MVHDLVLALVFLAMIIAPALLAMRSDREERDVLKHFADSLPPRECCCRPAPRRTLQRVAGMAFNFSAVQPDRSAEPDPDPPSPGTHRNPQRSHRRTFAARLASQPQPKLLAR